VSPRTAFRQYGKTNSSLTVGVTQPACLHLDGANSLEPRTSSKKATNSLSCIWWRCSSSRSALVPGSVVASTPLELLSRSTLVRCNCDSSYFFVVSSRWTVAISYHFRLDVHCFLSSWIIGWNMGVFKVSSFVIIMLWGLDMIQHIQRTSEGSSNIIEDDYSMTTPVSVSLEQSIIWIRTFDGTTFFSLAVWRFLPYVHWTSIYNFRRRQRQLPSGRT